MQAARPKPDGGVAVVAPVTARQRCRACRPRGGGYTLIEILIAVAVLGVLVALVVPAYQVYTVRAQVAEGLQLGGQVQAAVVDYYSQNGTWPWGISNADSSSNLNFTSEPTGVYLMRIDVGPGNVRLRYGNRAHADIYGTILSLNAAVTPAGDIVWLCGLATGLPAGATLVGTGETTVPVQYLPTNCRP